MGLHGDTQYESSIQSIIDELSTSTSYSEVIKEFSKVKDNLKNPLPHLFTLKSPFESLSTTGIGYYNAEQDDTRWMLTTHLLRSLKEVLQGIPQQNYLLYYPSQIGRSTLQTRDHRTTTGVPPSDNGRK